VARTQTPMLAARQAMALAPVTGKPCAATGSQPQSERTWITLLCSYAALALNRTRGMAGGLTAEQQLDDATVAYLFDCSIPPLSPTAHLSRSRAACPSPPSPGSVTTNTGRLRLHGVRVGAASAARRPGGPAARRPGSDRGAVGQRSGVVGSDMAW
jgi:hypothetical protein